ncbi:DHS-like NAD/FAD-binding domain-containing protein [Parathielavia appendiculata]|uniref:protein acetyllysine N-acetyltransferase n=1 Tax=Parathielavia appendiculata TaxID=2587402 RepID=A0AAN6Z5Z7_9PEZI|nr:DHS-like NAD/FAD-binding domain-containing protein [Parathielavia appendiculata]
MAWTADKVPLPELVEAPEDIGQKARQLAGMIRKSEHFIVFTGAGISTSAGIPDFRGPEGAWTLQAQGRQRTTAAVSTLQAIPTTTHMAIVELQNQGLMKYLVSQNCDGLHRRSGVLPDKISELHGNNNREVCKNCGKEYIRDFRAVADYTTSVHDHRTGRKCTRCGGVLHDTIINFSEPLPARELALALEHARKADLCLVLGSSLTVAPANEVPEAVGKRRQRGGGGGAKLVICNLQATPLDTMADLRVHAKTDELMVRVMRELELEIPAFSLERRLAVTVEGLDRKMKLSVEGVDVDGTPVSFLKSVRLVGSRRALKSEPFVFPLRGDAADGELEWKMELEFMGHYGEPNLELVHSIREEEMGIQAVYLLHYNPYNGEWKTKRL